MGAARPFREAGEMWCVKDSSVQVGSGRGHECDSGDDEDRAHHPARPHGFAEHYRAERHGDQDARLPNGSHSRRGGQ